MQLLNLHTPAAILRLWFVTAVAEVQSFGGPIARGEHGQVPGFHAKRL